jgi:hypothetical protein
MRPELTRSREVALRCLYAEQLSNGSFPVYAIDAPRTILPLTTFATSLILNCLNSLPAEPFLIDLKRRAASFLLAEKSATGSWNYHARSVAGRYPDDLDDTFCALSALLRYDSYLIGGEELARAAALLIAAEVRVGGPYRTWLVPSPIDPSWNDIDLAVNANVGYFLSLQGIELPSLVALAETAIATGNFTSRYYPSPLLTTYFLSNWHAGSNLAHAIRQLPEPTNSLDIALRVSSLVRSGAPIQSFNTSIKQLERTFLCEDWRAEATFLDQSQEAPIYAGSPALSAAFCLEALHLCQLNSAPVHDPEHSAIRDGVMASMRLRETHLSPGFALILADYKEIAFATDRHFPILTLPLLTARALGTIIEPVSLIGLGMALTYGWIAYTIYDNLVDGEGSVNHLPVANFALRQMVILFSYYVPDPTFHAHLHHTLDQQEEAVVWETANCHLIPPQEIFHLNTTKIPDYGDYAILADRAGGHALGALAVLALTNQFPLHSANLEMFFRHLLIARQLGDDAHDWEENLRLGQLNTVSVALGTKPTCAARPARSGYASPERHHSRSVRSHLHERGVLAIAGKRNLPGQGFGGFVVWNILPSIECSMRWGCRST